MLTPAPIYQSLTRPLQVAHAERQYAIIVIGTTMLLGVLGWYFWSIPCAVAAVAVFSIGIPFLRKLAKKDPHMIQASQRFYSYRRYYPARRDPNVVSGKGPLVLAVGLGLVLAAASWLFASLLSGVLALLMLAAATIIARRAA